ncbi:MAG TPA: hypothetical protein VF692_00345 [Pyrinomonadaceae bacterium]|jgi:hypothetical protein
MKLKTITLLSLVLTFSISAFGQTTTTVKPQPALKPAEAKPATAVKLPTVKEILDKYVVAIGGRAANERIKTRTMKGTIELAPMGIKGTVESFAAAPGKSYTKMNLQGIGEIVEGYDGTTAWTINPIQGNRDKTGDELLQMRLLSAFNREIDLGKHYSKMEVSGADKLNDRDVYVVIATPGVAALAPETFYFDKQTGLLLRSDGVSITPEGKMPYQTYFEDMREIDGVKQPYKTRVVLPQFEINTFITEVKHNVPVEDAKFAKPKQ